MAQKRLLTAQEVADQLAVSKQHVYALARQGKLPRVMVGDSVRFDPSDIGRFIADHRDAASTGKRSTGKGESRKVRTGQRLRRVQ